MASMQHAREEEIEEGEMTDDRDVGYSRQRRHQDDPSAASTSFPPSSSSSSSRRPPSHNVVLKTKGRGFASAEAQRVDDAQYEALQPSAASSSSPVVRSVEGYVLFLSGLHPESSEDDVREVMEEFGVVQSLQLPLERRSGYVKGYALVEYGKEEEARAAVQEGDGMSIMDRVVRIDWAFRPGGGDDDSGSRGSRRDDRSRRR